MDDQASAETLPAKLEAFRKDLDPAEQRAFDGVLRVFYGAALKATEDATEGTALLSADERDERLKTIRAALEQDTEHQEMRIPLSVVPHMMSAIPLSC